MVRTVFTLFVYGMAVHIITGYCLGDTIILKKKESKIEGKISGENKDSVTIETYPGRTTTVSKKDISQVTKGKAPWEVYGEKKIKIKDIPDEHYKLGKWCQDHNLPNEAKQEWGKAMTLDPEHKEARTALGYIKDDNGKWRLENEVMKEKGMIRFEGKWVPRDKFEELMAKGGYAFELKVTIEDDVDDKFLKEFADQMKMNSAYMWQCSRGQFYIRKAIIMDKSSGGNVVIPKGYAHTSDYAVASSDLGGKGRIASFSVPGQVDIYTFLHEFGHGALGLPDEKNPACRVCIMRGPQADGDYMNDPQYCTDENHNRSGPSCWSILMKQWPKLVGPNNDPGIGIEAFTMEEGEGARVNFDVIKEIPETSIEIINN